MDRAERFERLQVDVDTRLAEVWAITWDVLSLDDASAPVVGALLRAAYGVGYRDATKEFDEGRAGELARANGYTKEDEA